MSLVAIVAPTAEPISLPEAAQHLRADLEVEGDWIRDHLPTARELVEQSLGIALVTQEWELALDAFPCVSRGNPWGAIVVPNPPLQTVGSVKYTDTNGILQTLNATLYTVDVRSRPGRIIPAYGQSWPVTRVIPNAVVVAFTAGFGAPTAVPARLRSAVKVALATLNEYREDLVTGAAVARLETVRYLGLAHEVY